MPKIFTVQNKTFNSSKPLVSFMERTLVETLLEIRHGVIFCITNIDKHEHSCAPE